jgi:putative spermidine/putrescine transport system substrate-binding protein
MKRSTTIAALTAAALAAAASLAACSTSTTAGGSSSSFTPSVSAPTALGNGEGALNIIAWAGYAEDGSDDKTVDWVHPFENTTGCQVNVKIAGTSDEMVQLMRTGQYDGVSASGDATLRLVYGGDAAPVNTALVPNYATVSGFLKNQAWNSVGGQMYGIPHGWGANVLMYNKAVVKTAPTSWGAVFDQASRYAGKVTAYDSPIYIADAAQYLMAHKPELGIKDPYELTEAQLDAAVALLKTQNKSVGEYWSDYTKAVQAFESGTSVIGASWQVIANLIQSDKKVDVGTVIPAEGATGWSDTWMISSKAAHPNCMYEWMNWIISPKVNAQVAEWFGEAPSQTLACQQTADPGFCTTYHARDASYASQIHYWTTPQTRCVDGSGNDCTDYSEWVDKWQQVKG